MEICHFFVIFYDFVMKCVYKSTIYTFVIRDKIWTPPLCCTKVYMLLLCFGSRKHPPTPYMSGTFVLAPPSYLTFLYLPFSLSICFLSLQFFISLPSRFISLAILFFAAFTNLKQRLELLSFSFISKPITCCNFRFVNLRLAVRCDLTMVVGCLL